MPLQTGYFFVVRGQAMHFSVAEASQPVIGMPVVVLRLIVLKLKTTKIPAGT